MRTVLVSVLTLVMLTTSGAVGGAAYVCLMRGNVGSSCCCHHEQAKPRRRQGPVVARTGCCEVRDVPASHQPARVEATSRSESPVLAVAIEAPHQAPAPPRLATVIRPKSARGPPGSWPPLFVRHCSYLI